MTEGWSYVFDAGSPNLSELMGGIPSYDSVGLQADTCISANRTACACAVFFVAINRRCTWGE